MKVSVGVLLTVSLFLFLAAVSQGCSPMSEPHNLPVRGNEGEVPSSTPTVTPTPTITPVRFPTPTGTITPQPRAILVPSDTSSSW